MNDIDEETLLKKKCGTMLLNHSLRIFRGYDLLGKPRQMLETWFASSFSIFKLMLDNIKLINEKRYSLTKKQILLLVDFLKTEIEKL